MKNVIITDIKYRMAIGAMRELGKKGYKITAAEFENVPQNERLGHFSKYADIKALVNDDNFSEDIISLCKNERPVLLPVNRKALTAVIRNKKDLEHYCDFIVPAPESMALADDKAEISDIAEKIGVPIPKTTTLKNHKSIEEMAEKTGYPCIIKYRNGEAMGKKPHARYKIVNNKEEFIKAYSKMHSEDEYPIASDYIKGHDIGVAVVMNREHEPVDFICYESLREYPIEGGPTCYLKTIFDRQLLKYAVNLLSEIKFCGIAMLDFKGSIETPYFLEINPRVWGSANICDISKSSFFESYVKASINDIQPIDINTCTPNYKINAKMRFTPQSFACFISHMKKSPDKFRILTEYLKAFFDLTVKDGLFALNDLKPYIKYIRNLIKR